MPLLKKISASLLAAAIAAGSICVPTFADESYYGYNYGWWVDPVPSQNGYIVDRIITGNDLGVGSFNELNDMFVDTETGKFYYVDTKNNRIVITDEAHESATVLDTLNYGGDFTEEDSIIKLTALNSPKGVFVRHNDDDVIIYIADTMNSRVVACYEDGTIFREYTRPENELYDSNISFNPSKVVVDNALNVYVVVPSITNGMIQFAVDGTFNGYYGANRVETTAEVLQNAFYSLFMTREQMQARRRSVAIEISNCDIDDQGFIYTVTSSKGATTDVLKKLNPAGENIYLNMGYDNLVFGDVTQYYNGVNYASSIDDVDVDEDKNVFLLDFSEKRIFQYNEELDLEFIFGGEGTQKGLFTSPTAIENFSKKVYVTDSRKNSITVFKLTEFGELVHNAIDLFTKGLYNEAKEPFEEVIRRDSNYWYAYIGLGNAYYTMGENEKAMEYFYMNSRGGYNKAFREYRTILIRENFNIFMIVVIAIIVVLVVLSKVIKHIKKKKPKAAADNAGGDGSGSE